LYVINSICKSIEQYLQDNPNINGIYKAAVIRTLAYLQFRKLHTFHYDIHTPIIYNKFEFNEIFKDVKEEVIIKSIYGNSTLNSIIAYQIDNKIYKELSLQEITQINKGKPFFSVNDKALNDDMKTYITETFKNKTQYEQ